MSQTRTPRSTAFPSTRWSVILAAGDAGRDAARAALDSLCRTYWLPVYAFVRRHTPIVEDAKDLTQEFFARLIGSQLAGSGLLAAADPDRGRFRSLLLTAVRNFLSNEHERATAQKRGDGRAVLPLDFESAESRIQFEPADSMTPERQFEREWAMALLDAVLARLQREFADAGKSDQFEAMKPFLTGDDSESTHAALARRLEITAGAARAAVYRLRRRYRELLRDEIAQTVATDADVDDEIAALFRAFEP